VEEHYDINHYFPPLYWHMKILLDVRLSALFELLN